MSPKQSICQYPAPVFPHLWRTPWDSWSSPLGAVTCLWIGVNTPPFSNWVPWPQIWRLSCRCCTILYPLQIYIPNAQCCHRLFGRDDVLWAIVNSHFFLNVQSPILVSSNNLETFLRMGLLEQVFKPQPGNLSPLVFLVSGVLLCIPRVIPCCSHDHWWCTSWGTSLRAIDSYSVFPSFINMHSAIMSPMSLDSSLVSPMVVRFKKELQVITCPWILCTHFIGTFCSVF